MSMQFTQTVTATGAAAAIDTSRAHTLTFIVSGDASDFDVNVEVQAVDNGTWGLAQAAVTASDANPTNGPAVAIRLNVISLGTATVLTFEVGGSRHGG